MLDFQGVTDGDGLNKKAFPLARRPMSALLLMRTPGARPLLAAPAFRLESFSFSPRWRPSASRVFQFPRGGGPPPLEILASLEMLAFPAQLLESTKNARSQTAPAVDSASVRMAASFPSLLRGARAGQFRKSSQTRVRPGRVQTGLNASKVEALTGPLPPNSNWRQVAGIPAVAVQPEKTSLRVHRQAQG